MSETKSHFIDPRESAYFIAENADDVKVDRNGVLEVANEILDAFRSGHLSLSQWSKHELHPQVADDDAIEWIFLIDSLNFSFWSDVGEQESDGKKYSVNGSTGYWSLCAAVNRSLDRGDLFGPMQVRLTDARAYSTITLSELERIFESDDKRIKIPLLQQRLEILHENGMILIQKFGGKFKNCLIQSQHSARNLLQLVIQSFPSFRDEAVFKGRDVSFYKRAQILIADIWAAFQGHGDGFFNDISTLTMFADYRVPQILAYKNILLYSDSLMTYLKSGIELPSGHPHEVEIRGLSIYAVDLLTEQITQLLLQKPQQQHQQHPQQQQQGGSRLEEQNQDACEEFDSESRVQRLLASKGDPDSLLNKEMGVDDDVRNHTKSEGRQVESINSILIDFYLWDLRRRKCFEIESAAGIPFHKTRCIFY